MVLSVLPLAVISTALVLILRLRANDITRKLAPATAVATATVKDDGVGRDGLARLLAGTPGRVHCNPGLDRLLVVEVDGTPVWPAGRRRPAKPRSKGDWIEGTLKWTKGAQKQREREGGPEIEHVALARHVAG